MQVYRLSFDTGADNQHVFSTFFKAEEGLAQACALLGVAVPPLNPVHSFDGQWCYGDPHDFTKNSCTGGAINCIYIMRHDLDAEVDQTN